MRISDWSSDVCSSDLPRVRRTADAMLPSHRVRPETGKPGACAWLSLDRLAGRLLLAGHARVGFAPRLERGAHGVHDHLEHPGLGGALGDWQSVGRGTSGSVRVALGGRRMLHKK